MRDADPDISAGEWDGYRRILIDALYRAFTCKSGVRWIDALRALSIVYRNATYGHPRINTFINQAMNDRALLLHPLLHADVIIYKLDGTFA